MLRFDPTSADVDVDAMIMDDARQGIVILPWGATIPRVGDTFEYEEDGTRYVLEVLRFHPRAPTAHMRRHYFRPDYWLTARLKGVADLDLPTTEEPR